MYPRRPHAFTFMLRYPVEEALQAIAHGSLVEIARGI
jgi:hypothetical protein